MNQKHYCYSLVVLCTWLLLSCSSSKKINKDIVYFQTDRDSLGFVHFKELTIQPNDLLAIQIFSKSLNQEQAKIFNIAAEQGYLVDAQGKIEIPIIGLLNVSGLNRQQAQRLLESRLSNYIKDPSALVRFSGLKINVFGEVRAPGTKVFETDRVTILDALSAAGDLTEAGLRQNVRVIREEKNGERTMQEIDLRSAKLFQSPVYQLQQNDVVYVTPSEDKLKKLMEKKDPWRAFQVITSLIGVASTLVFIFNR